MYIITPSIASDNRGNIYTSFLKDEIDKLLPNGLYFKHDKFSHSSHTISNLIGRKGLWLPSATQLSDEEVQYVCTKIAEFYGAR